MWLFIFISLFIISIYTYLIIRYIFGWFSNFNKNNHLTFVEEKKETAFAEKNKITFVEGKKTSTQVKATIIVSCRNEEQNIANLLNALTAQDFNGKYEIIIIDDYSNDKTLKIVQAYAEKYTFVKLFSLREGEGKKRAIAFGIKKAKSDFVLSTDSDCTMSNKWLQGFYDIYKKTDAKLISALVLLEGDSFFEQLQQLEFLSLIASGAGSIGIKRGIMCNGANLAFSKTLFQNTNATNFSQVSGDDVFLLQTVKREFQNQVVFSPNKELIVRTKAKYNLKSFFNQRIRWASKSTAYSDFDMISSSWIVLLANFTIVVLFLISLLRVEYFYYFSFAFSAKALVDFIFLFIITNYLKQKKLLKFFIPLAVLYPFYILVVAVSSQLFGFEWKNRKS